MKKVKHLSKNILIISIAFSGFVFACVKQQQDIQMEPMIFNKGKDLSRIMNAQKWLKGNLPPETKSGSEWKSLWEYAFTDASDYSETVEVPLAFFKESVIVLPDCKRKFLETNDYKYIQNVTRLIVETDPQTGRTRGFFMSIVPSLKYLEKTDFNPFNNGYIERDSLFDGCIIFRDLNGKLVNGWMYLDGNIILSMKPVTNDEFVTKSTEYCQTTYNFSYIEWTYNNSAIVDYSNVEITEVTYCWIVAYPDGPGGGGSGGDGNSE